MPIDFYLSNIKQEKGFFPLFAKKYPPATASLSKIQPCQSFSPKFWVLFTSPFLNHCPDIMTQ
jgi:hypothetical protein